MGARDMLPLRTPMRLVPLSLLFGLALLSCPGARESLADEGVEAESEGFPVETKSVDPRLRALERAGRRSRDPKEDRLIARPDRKRPEKALYVKVFGRPLTLGGRYTFRLTHEGNRLQSFDFFSLDKHDADFDGDLTELESVAQGPLAGAVSV